MTLRNFKQVDVFTATPQQIATGIAALAATIRENLP